MPINPIYSSSAQFIFDLQIQVWNIHGFNDDKSDEEPVSSLSFWNMCYVEIANKTPRKCLVSKPIAVFFSLFFGFPKLEVCVLIILCLYVNQKKKKGRTRDRTGVPGN